MKKRKQEIMFLLPPLSLVLLLLLGGRGFCEELRIKSADELIDFSSNVNNEANYSGTTVFLDSDIDFSGRAFEPIGTSTNHFNGVFYGQGYIISNLKFNSTSQYTGLFGASEGTSIKNVVLDSSSSFENSNASHSNSAYLGGIIGYCYSNRNQCVVENTVNMASITFTGDTNGNLYLGGIAGYLFSSSSTYKASVKNCAIYGSISHSGMSGDPNIGGIVGYSKGSSFLRISIQNCLNYGTITNNNIQYSCQYIGGIVGYGYYVDIENCVSAGKITSKYSSGFVGAIVGYVDSSDISNCYWDKDISESACETIDDLSILDSSSFNPTTFELRKSVSVGNYTGASLLDALNAAADHNYYRDYSHWALNRNSNTVAFTMNERTNPTITLNSQIILLPSLASEGLLWFDGWYTDPSCASPLASFEITSDKELYGKWEENANSYTITFDTRREGVPIEPITAQFGSVVSLPRNALKDNCTIAWWEGNYDDVAPWDFTVPAYNLTLHAVWSCTVIRSAVDLVDFSRVVNSGASDFEGTTVFLDSDIDFTDEFSQQFEPIGNDDNNFLGTFDGQGHIISNLEINSYLEYVGLFGYSYGTTIRNVVMDSSCSITSSYAGESGIIGGVIELCFSTCNPCLIENTVNMASVTYSGNSSDGTLFLGGIAGELAFFSFTTSYEVAVKNCVNYGSLSNIGTSNSTYIGGIIGGSASISIETIYIQNCLNYGTILNNNNKESGSQSIGGIVGGSGYTSTENCVSAGKVTPSIAAETNIGSIVGYVASNTNITHCLWTSDVGYDVANGTGSPTVTDSSLISTLNATSTDELNEYAEKNSTLSRWVMLHLNGGSINTLTQEAPIGGLLKSLPVPVKEGNSFLFWCTDEECSEQYDPQSANESSVTDLYAIWTDTPFTVTFDGNGGTPSKESIVVTYDTSYGDLPTASRTGHTFHGWFTEEGEEVTRETTFTIAKDQILYAHWKINNYTVTFIFNNGTEVNAEFPFNSTITYPEVMVRDEFVFAGWLPNPERMGAEDLTIRAQWNITKPSEYVEIVFDKKDLSDEEAKEIIKNYVPEGEEFTIEKIYTYAPGGIKVIIKFTDQEKANEFIRNVNEHKRADDNFIKAVRPATDYKSFAFFIRPPTLFFILFGFFIFI